MPPTLENPFTPKKDLPTKRLFGGEEEIKKREPKTKEQIKEKMEKGKVKYGELKILYPQTLFLKEIEKKLIAMAKENNEELSEKEAVQRLTRLTTVDELGNIKRINLVRMKLKELPSLDELINLERLDCSYNGLESLPSLDRLTSLKELICYFDTLTSLPSLDKLINLNALSCGRNYLNSLPNLDKLTNLKSLLCNGNRFSPQEIAKIKRQVPKNCKVKI